MKDLVLGAALLLLALLTLAAFFLLQIGEKSKGFHMTLKAVCRRNGVYVSRVFHRININRSLAEPIYAAIEMMFANIFR